MYRGLFGIALAALASPALALNVLLTNDDGLTSNLRTLYDKLKAEGHDVIVSVPCSPQSGRGAALVMYSTEFIDAGNDAQIAAEGGCHNGAASIGAPSVGLMTRPGFDGGDFYYVHGSPVLATMYGLDVAGQERWGALPDLVLSGPNEGQNVGRIIISSGTVSNAQFAASRGIPSIALSADANTADDENLSNPDSATVADLTLKLLDSLVTDADGRVRLPRDIVLNVNFPKASTATTPFVATRIGTYDLYRLRFSRERPWGITISTDQPAAPTTEQFSDESVVVDRAVTVSTMQIGVEAPRIARRWLRRNLRERFQ